MHSQNILSLLIYIVIVFLSLEMNFGCSKTSDTKVSDTNANSGLIKRLIYSDETTKEAARKELAALDIVLKTKLIPELIVALKYKKSGHPNEVVYRYRAAETLGILGPIAKETAPDLIQAMKNDGSDLVQTYAVAALAKIGLENERVIPVLIEAFNDSRISHEAAEAIAGLGQQAVPALIEALKSNNIHLQWGAAHALGEMGPVAKEASPALLRALKSTNDNNLRNKFSDALKRIGPADNEELSMLVQDLKSNDRNIRLSAINALAIKGKSAIPSLIKLLADSDRDIRFWAAYILGRNKSAAREATTTLANTIKKDDDKDVRGNAIWALREIEPTIETSKDISDDELSAIDKIITMESKDDDILIQTIYRLENLMQRYPSSLKLDQVYFKSGLAKIAVGKLIGSSHEKSVMLKEYHEKNKDDYVLFLGVMYTGGDFKKLIEKHPSSPLAGDASYLMASEKTGVGECEGDVGCELNSSIGIYLSYIRDYPTHSKIESVIEYISNALRSITHDPSNGGLWEIFDIEESATLLKKYYEVVKTLPYADIRGDALYPLARAFVSVGLYEIADRIYSDLESNYPKYHNARTMAAYLLFDYSEKEPQGQAFSPKELTDLTSPLGNTSVNVRLEALDKISQINTSDRPLLFSLLLPVGTLSEKDSSAAVRKRAVEVIGSLASNTSFFRSAVGHCLIYDPDKQNQFFCATLSIQHPDLKNTEFYTYKRERITAIIGEMTGNTQPIEEMIAERRNKLMRGARESAEVAAKRAEAEGFNNVKYQDDMANRTSVRRISIFGTEYIFIAKKLRPEVVIPLWVLMMLLCGLLSYRIAEQRKANKRFWMILGALTAPISLLYGFLIPRRN